MSYKTLIIVDNSSFLTTLNQEIIKETVKYIIKNAPEDTSIAIAVTGENAEYICEYDDSFATKLKTAEDIKFADVNVSGLDTLMDVILNWKNDDLAMRDIIFMSGSDITYNAEYTLEELYYEAGSRTYPVYTLTCSQDGNAQSIKTISSVSRISGAKSFDVSDATEDANVEKQLGDKLLEALQVRREAYLYEDEEESPEDEYGDYEEESSYDNVSDSTENESYVNQADASKSTQEVEVENRTGENDLSTQRTSNMIYQLPDDEIKYSRFVVPVLLVVLAAAVFFILIRKKGKKDKAEEEKYYRKVTPIDSGHIDMSGKLPFEHIGEMENITMNLGTYDDDDEDSGTRLLFQARDGVEVTLEDRGNPTKYFKLCVSDSVVIGRNPKFCDVVIDYDDSVSSKHCEFYLRGGSVFVRDLNSSNGTMINQQKIYQEVKLESGDILRIGRLSFFVQVLGGGMNV